MADGKEIAGATPLASSTLLPLLGSPSLLTLRALSELLDDAPTNHNHLENVEISTFSKYYFIVDNITCTILFFYLNLEQYYRKSKCSS